MGGVCDGATLGLLHDPNRLQISHLITRNFSLCHDQNGINGIRNLVIVAKKVAKKSVNKVA